MSSSHVDHNLLFGFMALQHNFIAREELITAVSAWLVNKSRPLDDILRERRALADDEHQLVSALVCKHLERHGNDPKESLASISSVGHLCEDLKKLGDAEVEASLGHVTTQRPTIEADPFATLPVTESEKEKTRFRILRPHAEGGLGQVFVAQDIELNREVALKEIKFNRVNDQDSRSRFVLEAEITGGLEHPGIVPVYGLGQYADGRPFYAMRFIHGDSLAEAVDRFHAKPAKGNGYDSVEFRNLLGRFLDVCNAIEYAHSRGVLHRDLKPGNIMLGKYGETLVVDWGLAKAQGRSEQHQLSGEQSLEPRSASGSSATQMGSAIGTPAYMSPEQAAGRLDKLGPASDVYSLGATLYYVLTGQPPFSKQDNVSTALRKVQAGDFSPPRAVKPTIPKALEAICLKAMRTAPAERYASPRALADDTERYLADDPVSVVAEGVVSRGTRWLRRNRGIAATALLGLLLLTIGAIASALVINQQRQRADETRRRAFRYYYAAQMNLIQREWSANEVDNLRRRLELTKPEFTGGEDLRGFEWHYWNRAAHMDVLTIVADSGLEAVSFSEDGKRILTACGSTLSIWDAESGMKLKTMTDADSDILCAAFNHDATRIVSGNIDGAVKLWDAATGKELTTFAGHERAVISVAINHDGTQVVSGGEDTTLRIWNIGSQEEVQILPGHSENVESVVFNRDGTRIISGSRDQTIKVWNVTTGEELTTLVGHTGPVTSVAVGRDDTRIVSGSHDGTVRVWDVAQNRQLHELKGHGTYVKCVAISPDGTRIVSGGNDRTLRIWDANTGYELATLCGHGGRDSVFGSVESAAFNHDGTRIVSGNGDGELKVWDTRRGQRLLSLYAPSGSLAFSRDGTCIAYGNRKTAIVADSATGYTWFALNHGGAVESLAFSPDGRHLISGGKDAYQVWNTLTGDHLFTLPRQEDASHCVTFSHDGTRIAGDVTKTIVKIWDARDGKELVQLDGGDSPLRGVAFSPDGALILTASWADGTVTIWEVQNGRKLRSFKHEQGAQAATFNQDGTRIVTGGVDGTLRIWDASRGHELQTLVGHSGFVGEVMFIGATDRVASAGEDKTVRVWDTITGSELLTLDRVSFELALTGDGTRIGSTSTTGSNVIVFDGAPH
jgi:WD40 repeat protein/serine/threonine protein kinase